MNRREALKAIGVGAILPAILPATALYAAKTEKTIRTTSTATRTFLVKFNDEGMIANYKELMEGVPFVSQETDSTGQNCEYWECLAWRREQDVWIEEKDSLMLPECYERRQDAKYTEWVRAWGKVRLSETLDHSLSRVKFREGPSTFLDYYLQRLPESILVKKKNTGGWEQDAKWFLSQAMK